MKLYSFWSDGTFCLCLSSAELDSADVQLWGRKPDALSCVWSGKPHEVWYQCKNQWRPHVVFGPHSCLSTIKSSHAVPAGDSYTNLKHFRKLCFFFWHLMSKNSSLFSWHQQNLLNLCVWKEKRLFLDLFRTVERMCKDVPLYGNSRWIDMHAFLVYSSYGRAFGSLYPESRTLTILCSLSSK